jgi:hypothetical protein
MIQDAEKGKFDRIIFIKLDRFFRSVAEYHECMKRIAPVLWTTTEEEYDLTTANGRMLVNMKLTIAELEADQTGERISIVNEYKVTTGQPLVGDRCQPFGFINGIDEKTGRKNVIKNPDEEEIMDDLIDFVFRFQSKRKAVTYLKAKHHVSMTYGTVSRLLANTMLCGEYRGNPSYCEAYITREEFDKLQKICKNNVKENTVHRDYIFSGLIRCPHCGDRLAGGTQVHRVRGKAYTYKRYRCAKFRLHDRCDFNKAISENVLERLLLEDVEKYFEKAKVKATEITDAESVILSKQNVEDIHNEIDRLNYSWQTGKIRKVEQYEKQYAELMEKLDEAEAEQSHIEEKDFDKIEAILQDGWKGIYENLDDEHKRAFWRSFVSAIEIDWTTDKKEIKEVIFF